MVTIFATTKPFEGEIGVIQRNAILSWKKIIPNCEIIIFDNEKGTKEIAEEVGAIHIPNIKKNELGTPLVSDIFEKAQKLAKNNILVYINSDIIINSDFLKIIKGVSFLRYLIVGRRWDLDIKEKINFDDFDWERKLKKKVEKDGILHGFSGMDYFIFPKGLWKKIPPFLLGRTVWDPWLLYDAWISGAKLIDATEMVMIVHQNHKYANFKGQAGVWKGDEAKKNLKLAGGVANMMTIRDAEFIWTKSGLKKPKINFYRFFSFPFRYYKKAGFFKIFLFPGFLAMILWRKIYKIIFY